MVELETLEEIKADIIALKAKIAKAEDAQSTISGGPGHDMRIQRGDLAAMYKRLEKREEDYRRQAAREAGAGRNLARCGRPL
ncbi:MAG: hypothetical protein PHZ19_02535 [Candidatus Thermoplasmatota archaeon]|nr:hypothetical protein [Candidatus Thermoplasmatota archaeon]